jgi:O-antigen ligase
MLRRCLLGFITALIVARPFVLGEDPGLLNRLSSTSDLLLSMLWFVAAAAWAGWRAWFRQGTWSGAGVGHGLAGVAALVFLSAFVSARYRHPAVLVAWEWVILLLTFILVRQLAQKPAECQGLLAAVLATGVCLAAQAVYQSAVELPRNLETANDPVKLREAAVKVFGPLGQDDPRLEVLKNRLSMGHAFATYAHPNSFAGFLALLVPVAVGWVLAGRQRLGWSGRVRLAAAAALLLAVGLWLTHSRGAILALLLVGTAAAVAYGRRYLWERRAWVLAGLAVLVGAAVLASRTETGATGMEKAWRSFGQRMEYWAATWKMIHDHPWLGVGPGNFGRLYPRYMAPAAFEKILDPHNFALELWATSGFFAMLALVATIAVFLWRIWSVVRGPWSVAQASAAPAADYGPRTGWAFYLGGVAGLLLGFLLRAGDLSAEDMLKEGLLSGLRSLLWFAVFILFDGVDWSSRSRTLAITAGVAALLLNLCVSGGIAFPSVAQPLWVLVALALNGAEPQAEPRPSRTWLAAVWPLPLLAGAGLAYLVFVFLPVTSCAGALDQARLHYGDDPQLTGWRNQVLPRWSQQIKEGTPQDKARATANAVAYLKQFILEPLEAAVHDDPGASVPLVELAYWYQERWKLLPDPEPAYRKALDYALLAQKLDPDSSEGYLAEYQLHKLVAERFKERAKEQYGLAARAFQAVVDRDLTEARLHYELAEVLFQAGDPVKARQHAARAQELDRQATVSSQQLTEPQRAQVVKWLAG